MKGWPHEYSIKYLCCMGQKVTVCNLEVYQGAHFTDLENNTLFDISDGLYESVKYKKYVVYMDRWFTSPRL
jgi:hypothetical protein